MSVVFLSSFRELIPLGRELLFEPRKTLLRARDVPGKLIRNGFVGVSSFEF